MYLREALENVRKLKESVDLEIKENRNDKNKTEEEKANFKPSTDPHTINLMEQMILNLGGNYSKGRASIKESLTTTDAVKLIPKIIEGKLNVIKYSRENNVPFLGICLGMQCAVIEYARNVLELKDANSHE